MLLHSTTRALPIRDAGQAQAKNTPSQPPQRWNATLQRTQAAWFSPRTLTPLQVCYHLPFINIYISLLLCRAGSLGPASLLRMTLL